MNPQCYYIDMKLFLDLNRMKRYTLGFDKNKSDTLLRIFLSIIFIMYGLKKFENIQEFITLVESMGFASIFAYLVAYIQFIGGILLFFNIGSLFVLPLFACIMFVAILFVGLHGNFEYQLSLLLITINTFYTLLQKK